MSVMPLKEIVSTKCPQSAQDFEESIKIVREWIAAQLKKLETYSAADVLKFVDGLSKTIDEKKGIINSPEDVDVIYKANGMALEYECFRGGMRIRFIELDPKVLEAFQLANAIDAVNAVKQLAGFEFNIYDSGNLILGLDLNSFEFSWDYGIDQCGFWLIENPS